MESPLERRWRSIAENPFDFVVVIGPDYKYRFVNHTAPGIDRQTLIGKATPFDFVDAEQLRPMKAAFDRAFHEGVATSYEVYVAPLDQWFSNIVGPIKQDGQVVELSILTRNITESKRAEVERERSERRLRLALEGANTGLFDADVATGEVYYSPTFYRLLGHADGDPALDRDELERRLHPDDHHLVRRSLTLALEEGQPFAEEFRVCVGDERYRWFLGHGNVMTVGNRTRLVGILSDVNERREHLEQRKQLEAQLWQAQKVETVGTLAGGIAHDLNNALTPVLGFADLALSQLEVDHPAHMNIASLLEAAERARDVVRQVLLFSRRADENHVGFAAGGVARDAMRLASASKPVGVELQLDLPVGGPRIMADVTQFHQIVTNLCTNAFHAMSTQPGKLLVSVKEKLIPMSVRLRGGTLTPGRYCVLSVRDTGPGISEEVLPHILEPFFTTKPAGEGTGLGLSVVNGIVLRHRGALDVHSEPGKGTTFRVYFPVTELPPLRQAPDSISQTVKHRDTPCRILLVEDDPRVASVQAHMLETLGHETRLARSAASALSILDAQADGFNLIITDHVMQGGSGVELTRQVRGRGLAQPVLMVTGIIDPDTAKLARTEGITDLLMKPFTLQELDSVINRLLSAPLADSGFPTTVAQANQGSTSA